MKKIISVLLALLILGSVIVVSVSAAGECTCDIGEKQHDNSCLCCLYCSGLPQGRIVSCAKKSQDGTYTMCCDSCRGFIDIDGKCGCDTECKCCVLADDTTGDNGADPDEDTPKEDEQPNNEKGFLAFFKRISDAIERFFEAILKFLKLN